MTTVTTLPPPARNWVLDNPVVVVSSLSVVIAGMKVLAVSGGNADVLRTLVQTLDISSLVTATILPIIPNVIIIAVLMYADKHFEKKKQDRTTFPEWAMNVILLFTFTLMLLVPVFLLITYVLFFISIQYRRYKATRRGMILTGVSYAMFMVYPLTTAITSGTTPWIPQENVYLQDQDPVVAYVLSSDVRWTTLLYKEASVDIIATPTVLSRKPCAQAERNVFSTTLAFSLSSKRSDLPSCVEAKKEQNAETTESEEMANDALKWAISSLVVAVIAGIIALFALARAGTTDQRDRNVWRLTTLKDDVAAFLRSSEKRSEKVKKTAQARSGIQPDSAVVELEIMKTIALRISSLTEGDLDKVAKAIIALHEQSDESFNKIKEAQVTSKNGQQISTLSDNSLAKLTNLAQMDGEYLKKAHEALILSARKEYGIHPRV